MSWTFLSHELSETTPGYGGKGVFHSKSMKQINCGDSCNTQEWRLNNHAGTHIDAPKHFDENGSTIESYPPEFWFFKKITLLDCSATPDLLIESLNIENANPETDLLLIRTGFEKLREENIYWENNPGLTPELAKYLRQEFSYLRAVGVDFISASSFQNREVGREAHEEFLAPDDDAAPILIIEDMHLKNLSSNPLEVLVSPLRVNQADGAPVTVFAKI